MNKNGIIKIYGTDYKEMTLKLLHEADLVSDIPENAKCIGIKPNLVTPTPASYGATTHVEIVEGIIEYLKSFKDFDICIAEGSWVGDKTHEAFDVCGYKRLSEVYGVNLIDTQKDGSHEVDVSKLFKKEFKSPSILELLQDDEKYKKLYVNNCVDKFDYLINVPVLKGHCQTKITCALKNMKGLIPNEEKRRFHTLGLHKPIAYLNACIHQDFIITDHICGDLDFEEGGNPVVKNCIMAAKDPVLMDAYVCKLLGYKTDDVKYVKIANDLGIGCADIKKLQLKAITQPDNKNDSSYDENIKESNRNESHSLLDVSYAVCEIDSCSACYGTLIPALTKLKKEGLLENLNQKISIGQGQKGKTGSLGVGDCTKDFNFYIPGCPPSEEDMYKGIKDFIDNRLSK